MKIIKTGARSAELVGQRLKANLGCNRCPCCGENRKQIDYWKEGITHKGISSGGICKNWAEGFFKIKVMQIDCYKCYTCGAEWESDPYEI